MAVAGARYACHAEFNVVPKNLVTRLPDEVSFEQGAYTTIAAIAMQGVRLTDPAIGEFVAVIGLGLIGLLTVQILAANGCKVLGIDLSEDRRKLGLEMGLDAAEPPDRAQSAVDALTRGWGVDHTIISAATKSNDTVIQAGEITRRRGSVVVVGSVGMDIPRETYFKKELRFQISMSQGPGRYDPTYEEGGLDYPYEYVRWTEGRNMEAVVSLMKGGQIDVERLTTKRFLIADALDAYELVTNGDGSSVGILLEYGTDAEPDRTFVKRVRKTAVAGDVGVSFIGAGNYASSVLLPAVDRASGVRLEGLVTATGISSDRLSKKYDFRFYGTDSDAVMSDDATDLVIIATRHSTHAELAIRGLQSGKHVFVEKPMAITPDQLTELDEVEANARGSLTVGVNRRFAPMVVQAKQAMQGLGPKQIVYRVNSGPVPADSWIQLADEGGGMLVGEMVHFVDVMQYLSGSRPESVHAKSVRTQLDTVNDRDNLVITIGYGDGSVGVLAYNTLGDKSAPKERIEVFGGGTVVAVDDFRRLSITVGGKTVTKKSASQDKGQTAMIEAVLRSIRMDGRAPIPFEELRAGMDVIFAAARSIRDGEVVSPRTGVR